MTRPSSRIRSSTSASPLGLGARWRQLLAVPCVAMAIEVSLLLEGLLALAAALGALALLLLALRGGQRRHRLARRRAPALTVARAEPVGHARDGVADGVLRLRERLAG